MQLTVNGEVQEVADDLTVEGLLQHLGIRPVQVAVEVNLDIIPKAEYARRTLHDGDSVEVVSFVGGG